MNSVIKVEDLSKKYVINHQNGERKSSLHDHLQKRFRTLFQRANHSKGRIHVEEYLPFEKEEFWALRDVSFEINEGERVGIIGRNGAGKSTLLKILSRIVKPTTGRVSISKRVSALLEVGTGFHPELTGRENIFLNGIILGMNRYEIRRRFDEIVEFAEIQRFLDTPVKHYSSGMYVRLAFSVAAHLEPEILIIDEVLAVGDALFQKKCLGKMEEAGRSGKTVLLVSHNMATVLSLCGKAILLNSGKMGFIGDVSAAIHAYYSNGAVFGREITSGKGLKGAHGSDVAEFLSGRILDKENKIHSEIRIDEPLTVEMDYLVKKEGESLTPNFHFFREDGTCAFATTDATMDFSGTLKSKPGRYRSSCYVPGNLLNDGVYFIGLALSTMERNQIHFYEKDVLQLHIIDSIFSSDKRGKYTGHMPGAVRPTLAWSLTRIREGPLFRSV